MAAPSPSKADPRARTQSMAQRLSKQPLSEGFDLWDRGYVLGSMRLFTFKAENAPPFQVGMILDAMGHLLLQLGEFEDARENFTFATEKYELIQQPILAKIMSAKAVEATKGPEEAFALIDEAVKQFDGEKQSFDATLKDKIKAPFGRLYHYRAQLLLQLEKVDEALVDVKHAVELGYDRIHLSLALLGNIEEEKGNKEAAVSAYQACITKNPNLVSAYLPLAMLLKEDGKLDAAKETLDKAIALHPRAVFLRQKAYLLSEAGAEKDALEFLDAQIAHPPHEEAEAMFSASGSAVGEFHKAKAAILADAGKMAEAKVSLQAALALYKDDEEANSMMNAINNIKEESSPEKTA